MLIAALPTDLHLYARPPTSCSIPLLVPMSWPPMQLIARPRSKLRPGGRSCAQHRSRTLASSTHSQARSNRPRTLSNGGMSYGKLPSGACGLIRSLRVSRLVNCHDTESNISPTLSAFRPFRFRGVAGRRSATSGRPPSATPDAAAEDLTSAHPHPSYDPANHAV